MRNPFSIDKRFMFVAAIAFLSVADVFGGVISVLPEPVSDGAYELGNPTFYEDCFNKDVVGEAALREDKNPRSDQCLTAKLLPFLGYIDWDELKVPAGATVRFVGGVLLDKLPPDYNYDWSKVTHICIINDLSPDCETLHIPAGVSLRLPAVNLAKSEDGKSFTLVRADEKVESGFHTNLDIDGTLFAGDGTKEISLCGSVTGAGELRMDNFSTERIFHGKVDFGGKIHMGASQQWQKIRMSPTEKESIVNRLIMDYLNQNLKTFEYAPCLAQGECGVLNITNSTHSLEDSNGGALSEAIPRRIGNVLQVYSNNTIHVKTFRSGVIHLVADSDAKNPTFDMGVGNVVFDQLGYSGNVKVFPSANINLTINKVWWYRNVLIDYTAESNKVNVCTLDFSNDNIASNIQIRGYSPAFLPRKILADAKHLDITTNVVLDSSWKFPFDFASEDPEEINPWRCESMGVLQVPETGAIEIAAIGGKPVTGIYPLMTCTTGGGTLRNWTVNFTGEWYGAERTVLIDETGLRLAVKVRKGTVVTVR